MPVWNGSPSAVVSLSPLPRSGADPATTEAVLPPPATVADEAEALRPRSAPTGLPPAEIAETFKAGAPWVFTIL